MVTLPINQGYMHRLGVAGNVQFQDPAFFGITPLGLIAGVPGNTTTYTAANRATVSVDDLLFVQRFANVNLGTTRRMSHMFRYNVGAPNLLTAISNLTRFGFLVNGIVVSQFLKLFIWDDNAGTWLQLDIDGAGGTPRTMNGSVLANWSDFVDAGNWLYILLWDWEGTNNAGGCLHESTMIHTPDGMKSILDITPWNEVIGWENEIQRAKLNENPPWKMVARAHLKIPEERGRCVSTIDEVTLHKKKDWDLVRVTVRGAGEVVLTPEHPLVTSEGDVLAGRLKVDDKIECLNGLRPVESVENIIENCKVVDVWPRSVGYFVNDGICVRRMEGP